jgi:hypothetical protein
MNRTIVRVIGSYGVGRALFVVASVPGWKPHSRIRFRASLIPKEIRDEALKPGTRLFAYVNLEASKPNGLRFDKFELVPEPDENDGLG